MPGSTPTCWCVAVDDEPRQSARVAALFDAARAEPAPLFVPNTVMLELEWVLRSRYRFGKPAVLQALNALLETQELEFEVEAAVERALHLYRLGAAEFADCLHAGICGAAQRSPLLTFDRLASRMPASSACRLEAQPSLRSRASASRTKSSRSWPKNISSPTNIVGAPKTPRAHRLLGVGDQCGLDLRVGDDVGEAGVEAGRGERLRQHLGLAEVARFDPHGAEDRLDVAREILRPAQLHAGRAAHQGQRVDREVRVEGERHAVAFGPARDVAAHPAALRRHRHRARVARRLEHAAEQHRPPVDRRAASRRRSSAAASRRGRWSGCRSRRRTRSCGSWRHPRSPFLRPRPQIHLVGPGAALLAVELPVVLGDGIRVEDAVARLQRVALGKGSRR